MTRTEHYAEAERLLASIPETEPGANTVARVAEAQVHATLAAAVGTDGPVDFSAALAIDPFLTASERDHIHRLWRQARQKAGVTAP